MIVANEQSTYLAIENSQFTRVLNLYHGHKRSLLPYMAWSTFLSVSLFGALFFYEHLYLFDQKQYPRQVMDIEFVSPTDFQNKHEILPASKPKHLLAKVTSPIAESRGELFAPPIFVVRTQVDEKDSKVEPTEKQPNVDRKMYKQEEMVAVETEGFVDITKLASRFTPVKAHSAVLPVKALSGVSARKFNTDLNLEEVKPPELIEVKENEGESGDEVWQTGGRSKDGAGAYSSLSEYLKDLHKKLKQHWTPPAGAVHHIKVNFRLDRAGNVSGIKLINSSGNATADSSAIEAIKEASPYGVLPPDYSAPYLDLAYSFNYTTDELKEIERPRQDP